MRVLFGFILFFSLSPIWAHEGEDHGSGPVLSSSASFSGASENGNPLSIDFKLRSGYSYGSYFSAIPSLSSYFGDEALNLNLNYEFQFRQYSSEVESEYEDRDFNNHLGAGITKMISDNLSFTINGAYELSQAVRIARLINDYTSTTVNSNLAYKFTNNWAVGAGYMYGIRLFPNGTYLIPSSTPSGAGEPIVPNEPTATNSPVTIEGITDNKNEVVMSASGDLGAQTLNLETKYIVNNSDLTTRRYNAQAFKAALARMLWSRIFAQISYSIENRIFSDRSDNINIAQLGLQKELSARMSITGLARNNQTTATKSGSIWEGYAQLQYAF